MPVELVGEEGPEFSLPHGRWCGQTQPHGPHPWSYGELGLLVECSGHS